MFTWLDYTFLVIYVVGLIASSLWKNSHPNSEVEYLLAGRKLTVPAFVATLVSTWYGGILGVGEFGYQYGLAQWLVFSFPYYLFALGYAFILVKRIKKTSFLSIPEAVSFTYGNRSSKLSALLVFLLANPAPYFVMTALLLQFIFPDGASYGVFVWISAIFSMGYVLLGGFRAVVRTDIIQFALMYVGFALLLFFSLPQVSSWNEFSQHLPESLLKPSGDLPISVLIVWFFIALWTFADPGFHQRVSAAKNEKTAQVGIFISVGFWALFDSMTVSASLIGRYLLPELENPALVYPELGNLVLPSGVKGLFFLGLLATIMSTSDSFLFLSGQSISRDLFGNKKSIRVTQIGIIASTVFGGILAITFPSVIDLWYGLGSCLIPPLLIAISGTYFEKLQIPQSMAFTLMIMSGLASFSWLILQSNQLISNSVIEPFYPGLIIAVLGIIVAKLAKLKS